MRANSTISILSAAGSEKIAVPITAASRRRWKLMEEDSITLYFNLEESIDFAVGDYIVDEVFGRFVISEEPIPADYDSLSGAYKYTLRFDADWICWKNYILMLTYNGVRKETSWVLTDTLENHLAVVVQNLAAVGYTGYSVNVDANTVPDKGKAVCVTYSGTTVLDALKNLADAYECEFWLDGKVIRFGKCLTGTMTDLSMTNENGRTINVENMVPMRNDSEYGNRFFAYGSTKNLPETYRKHLSFKADTTSRIGGYTAFKDSLRPMFPDFLKRSIVQTSNPTQHSYEDDWPDYSYTEEEDHDEMTTWKNIRVEKTTNPIPVVQGWPFTITPYTSQYGSFQYTVYIYDQDGNLLISTTNTLVPMTYTIPEGVDKITVRYSFESETHLSRPAPLPPTVEWLDNTEYAYFATVSYTGGTFLVRLMDGWFRAVNSRTGTVTYKNPPSGFTTNTEYTLLATGDDPIKVASIPYSYYTDDDDTTDAVRVLGERRLMLPRPPYTDSDLVAIQSHIENGYVQRSSISRDQIVERVVFFDEIYPRCALRITQVDVGEYANDTTYSDGSVKIANLPSYTLQAQLVTRSGDVAFPFDPETMMVVGKLTATFLTPDEAKVYSGRTTENACSLMGMTFDVACNRSNGVTTYQLVWNSDYGEKLPNEILMPKVGDCFILAGWNPAAMSTLGLIDAAEKELALTADRYAELLEEAQFNFDCTMMSDWVKAWYDGKTPVSGELPFRRLILPGQSVRVFHGALSAPKETRVIGFEYKLDIPYDSPVLTVGESDAYSRLREIEKSLHASSQSSTATSNTTSVNITGGSAAQGGGQTLHLTPGTMTGMSPVDYNGSEEKTFRVPSVIDHLVDSDKVPRIATNIAGDKVLVDKEGNEVSGKQFFEEKTDPNDSTKKYIWLKDEYTGLGVPGWLASGGVGNGAGGGGGIISSVYGENRLGTIYSAGGSESLTETFSAFAIDKVWQAVFSLQQSMPNVSLSNGSNYSTITVNNSSAAFYTKSQVDALLVGIHSFDYVTASSLPTAGADTMYKIYLIPSADPQTGNIKDEYITIRGGSEGSYTYSWEQVGSTAIDLTGYVTLGTAQTITGLKTFSGGIVMKGSDIVPSADLGSQLGYSSIRFSNGNIMNVYTRNIYFKHQTTGKTDGVIAGGDGYLRFRTGADVDTSYKDIVFHETYGFYPEQSGVNLGYNGTNYRWANIYGVNLNLSGAVTSGAWNGTPIANEYLAHSMMTIAGANVSLGGSLSVASLKSNLGVSSIESEIAKFNSWFSEDADGNILVNPKNGVPRGFYTAGFLASGGIGAGGASGGGGSNVAWGTATEDSVQLSVDNVIFNLSKAGVSDHFTGYIGASQSNSAVDTSSLEEYTDQAGKVSLTFSSASYLWVCLERNGFSVESEGIEIPMEFVTSQNNVNCYVSKEKLNAGTVGFVVKYDKTAKPDSERLVITARSYTITYGDPLPDFAFTANGEVEGTPTITCAATSGSGVGTYNIIITRGSVTDANAVYVNGTLTIEKANLVITADDKFVEQNGTMPTFTVQYSGFVKNETPSVLTSLPSCTTNAQGTGTIGTYNITPSGATAQNYSFTYVPGHLYVGEMVLLSWTSAQVNAGGSIGGFIDTSAYTKKTSKTYWGIALDVDGYQGCTIKFTRASGVNFFRFAFMRSCANWTNNSAVDYSSATGYTSLVQVNAATAEAVIPADTKYVYVYTNSNGTNYAPDIEIKGAPHSSTTMFLTASMFTANKTIGANGTVYTGNSAKAVCCTTNMVAIKGISFNYLLSAVVSHMPSVYDSMLINIALYNSAKAFIKRLDYRALPNSWDIEPGASYAHIMITGTKNGSSVEISSVPIGNNDIQLTINDF